MLTLKKIIKQNSKGFTLLEVLLVVAIIAILAGIVILAINPNKQLADSRNAQRSADVNTILNATYQYALDTGSVPASITGTATQICRTGGTCTGITDLGVLVTGNYLSSIPMDPKCNPTPTAPCTANSAGYTIMLVSGRVTVNAPLAENSKTITVVR
jgi:type IV pilus assembly protein PilA